MTTQPEQGLADALEREIRIAARPETIFGFFTDPAKMLRWKGIQAELEPVPGGIYRVDIDGRHIARGKYVEVVPPSRVVFTWGWEDGIGTPAPGASTVEITLVADGDGTILHLRHSGLTAEERGSHGEGWDQFLSRLVDAAEERGPQSGS
jgi:uncharacterized protein YndB with AHSA1/START domain